MFLNGCGVFPFASYIRGLTWCSSPLKQAITVLSLSFSCGFPMFLSSPPSLHPFTIFVHSPFTLAFTVFSFLPSCQPKRLFLFIHLSLWSMISSLSIMSTERGNGNTGRSVTELWRCCSASGSCAVPSTWGSSSLRWAAWVGLLVQAWGGTCPHWLLQQSPVTEKTSHLSSPGIQVCGYTVRPRLVNPLGQRPESPVGALLRSLQHCACPSLSPVWTWFSLLPFSGCSLHARSVYHLERWVPLGWKVLYEYKILLMSQKAGHRSWNSHFNSPSRFPDFFLLLFYRESDNVETDDPFSYHSTGGGGEGELIDREFCGRFLLLCQTIKVPCVFWCCDSPPCYDFHPEPDLLFLGWIPSGYTGASQEYSSKLTRLCKSHFRKEPGLLFVKWKLSKPSLFFC